MTATAFRTAGIPAPDSVHGVTPRPMASVGLLRALNRFNPEPTPSASALGIALCTAPAAAPSGSLPDHSRIDLSTGRDPSGVALQHAFVALKRPDPALRAGRCVHDRRDHSG
jgi:hypothetical protein